jgi:hypothetical protein
MNAWEDEFPRLRNEGYIVKSQATRNYNCIAWAAGDTNRWWWPDAGKQYHWPEGIPRDNTVDAFIAAYTQLGYEVADSQELEEGLEKVAIYTKDKLPTHAARQLPSGMWTSKLGREEDIEHTLRGLTESVYGEVAVILCRPRSAQ